MKKFKEWFFDRLFHPYSKEMLSALIRLQIVSTFLLSITVLAMLLKYLLKS